MEELNYESNLVEDDRIKLIYDDNEKKGNSTFPIYNQEIWNMYKNSESVQWTVQEVDYSKDKKGYEELNPNEKFFVKKILAFFSNVDGIVARICDVQLSDIFKNIKELETLYRFQARMEDVHNETYSTLIDTMIIDTQEKLNVLNGSMIYSDIKEKVEWITINVDPKKRSLPYLILAQAIVEGVLFSGAFCAIYWFKKKNVMPGLTLSNEFIARDEGLHTETGVMVYNLLKNKLNQEEAHRLMTEAVNLEKKFITESIPCNLIGMNDKLMCQYIEFIADRLLVQVNYEKIYNSSNPFDFMEQISVRGKSNFFEHRNSEYQTMNKKEDKNIDNSFQSDFDF